MALLNLYLEPDAAFAVVQKLGRDMNEQLSLGSRTLQKRLKERNLLVTVESDHLTARVELQGKRRRILHLRAGILETYIVEKRANRANRAKEKDGRCEATNNNDSWPDLLDRSENRASASGQNGPNEGAGRGCHLAFIEVFLPPVGG